MLVHFPIGLLATYSVLELLKHYTKKDYWFNVRAVLLYLGLIGAFAALGSGGLIEDEFKYKFVQLFEMHELFASISTWLYFALALYYIIIQFEKELKIVTKYKIIDKIFKNYKKIFDISYIRIIIVLLALIAITITGALGAAMVSGPNVDPIVSFIYSILIK